ncbi:protein O-mannosyltransferase 1-like [Panonychus citri]|uniref:protein O-mannosyltransferase 1-like n=1 Tax=Panonychus citri TaxID=50023 RepID=UPI00230738F9|nr:protein O-mannosyltransferase 1-like [Panonychus citri]
MTETPILTRNAENIRKILKTGGKEIKDKSKTIEKDDISTPKNNKIVTNGSSPTPSSIINKSNNLITKESQSNANPFSFTIEINVVAWLLFFVALGFRLYLIGYPPNIVFDELHYGKFVSLYMKGVFYFDSQPPLGKQLIAAIGYLAGFDGNNAFNEIGGKYNENVPLKVLRAVPAVFGSLLIPTIYHLISELGFSHQTAALASIFVILENALLTQSRFILMESILLFMSFFGLFSVCKLRKKPILSKTWLLWLLSASTFLSFGFCVKFVGIYFLFVAIIIIVHDFWWLLPNRSIPTKSLWLQAITYFFFLVVWPLIIYTFIFFVHLSVLTKAGPHDNVMTSAFQASLEGGLASITKGQPLEIVHGSQVTLRHTHGRTCWLHSHAQVYPVKYSDGRGSSHQQQVTCYSFKDVNNWWIVKRPTIDDLIVSEPRDKIKHGDFIQIIHGMTSRKLNSHDVAAPMSPQHQEVSCYIDYNISMISQDLWKVDLLNKDETGGFWHTIRSKVRLVHVNSSQALKFTGKLLPDWGYNQHEVVTDRIINQDDTIWNVEEHRYTKLADQKERERDMVDAEFVPLTPTFLSFWEKMKELQYKMLTFDQENIPDHMFACDSPLDWLFLTKGIAYWIDSSSNSQIYLIGNIFLWYLSLISVAIYCCLGVFYLIRKRRNYHDLSEEKWTSFKNVFLICLIGYLINLIPHFLVEKTLFLHHYLPSLLFKLLITATLFEHLKTFVNSNLINCSIVVIIAITVYYFTRLLPLSYGSGSLTIESIENLKLLKTWNLIVHK